MVSYRVVRFISLLMFLGGLFGSALGQSVCEISATYEDESLEKVIKDISETCELAISYDPNRIKGLEVSRLVFKRTPVEEALFRAIEGQQLKVVKIAEGKFSLAPVNASGNSDQVVLRRVSGVVVDGSSGTEMPGVAVVIGDNENGSSNLGVLTDEFGKFEIVLPSDQGDFLEARSLGYQPSRIPMPEFGQAIIVITELPLELETVLVTGRQEQIFSSNGNGRNMTVRVSPRHVGAISVLGEKDVFRSLQMIPGVSGTEESSNGVYVRGSTPDQTLVLIDGMPIYNTGHFFGMFHAFNADALERVDVSRGGFNVSQGGAVGGLISIDSRPRIGDSLSGGISANLAATSAHLSLPLANDRIAVMVAGRRSYSDIIQSPLYAQISGNVFQVGSINEANAIVEDNDSAFFEADPLSNFSDLHVRSVFDLEEKGRLSAGFYNGRDVVGYVLGESYDDDSTIQRATENLTLVNNVGGVAYEVDIKDNLHYTANAYVTNYRGRLNYDYLSSDQEDTLALFTEQDNQVTTGAIRNNLNWQLNPSHQLQFGWQYQRTASGFYISDDEDAETDDDEDPGNIDSLGLGTGILSLWAGYTWKHKEKFIVSPGLRITHYGLNEEFYFEPRLQASLSLTGGWRLNGNVGYYLQYLNPVQINNNLKLGTEFLTLASEDNGVDGVASWQGGLGVSYLKPGIWVDVQGYLKYMDGIQRYAREFDPNLNGNEFGDRLSDGEGLVMGGDLFIRGNKGPWSGWMGYTLNKVLHFFPGLNQGEPFAADHDHRHELKLASVYKWRRFEFSAQWTLASGKPYSQYSRLNTIVADQDTIFELEFDRLNNLRLPAYHRLDVNASYQFKTRKWGTAKIGISVFNLYNRENIRDRNFAIEYTDDEDEPIEVNTVDRTLLGLSPNLFLRISF